MNLPAYIHLPAKAVIRTEVLTGRLARYAVLRLRLWWQEQAALREIATLDERTLRDIGASRANVIHHAGAQRERVLMREFGGAPFR